MMAADLAKTPNAGIRVQACGDAHISNFGIFATPERNIVFDLNDFDETLPAPFEWDVKRLAVSVEVVLRGGGVPRKARTEIVSGVVAAYRHQVAEFAGWRALDIWYARISVPDLVGVMPKAARASMLRDIDRASAQEPPRRPEQADRGGRRAPPVRRRPAGPRAPAASGAEPDEVARRHRQLPPVAVRRAPGAVREVHPGRRRAQGRRRSAASDPCWVVLLEGPHHPPATRCSSRSRRPGRRCSSPHLGRSAVGHTAGSGSSPASA